MLIGEIFLLRGYACYGTLRIWTNYLMSIDEGQNMTRLIFVLMTFLSYASLSCASELDSLFHPSTDRVVGPVPAYITRYGDDGLFDVEIKIWIDLKINSQVRLAGIDVPHIRSHCEAERLKALNMKSFIGRLVGGRIVKLHDIRIDQVFNGVITSIRRPDVLSQRYSNAPVLDVSMKYVYVAKIDTFDGVDISKALIDADFARFRIKDTHFDWCN